MNCFAFNDGIIFLLLSVILICLQHMKNSYFSGSNLNLWEQNSFHGI